MQPTQFCNIDCSYCYLSNRTSTARMSLETLDLICQRLFESPLLGASLDLAWHGGEPLAVPLSWYEQAVALVEQRRPAHVRVKHCFQTNGLLMNDAWVEFFARTGARVGLSIDGPADLHNSNRRTRRGGGTHKEVMRAVSLLQEHGHDFHVITVLTEPALDEAEKLFEFYVLNKIKEVGFNIEEVEGINRVSSLAATHVETRFRNFVQRFLNLVWSNPGMIRVREFEDGIAFILSRNPVRDPQNVPFNIVSISHDGVISTFSPELLGAHHMRFTHFGFGHVSTHRLEDVEREPLFQTVSQEIERGVHACECTCPYFRWCGGGAPANKLFETGGFDTTETMHCRLTRKILLDELLALIETHLTPPDAVTTAEPVHGNFRWS
ncbi:cyclophane-forming radical SAM/SPASM peptide maturase GrrM/OscB [Microvirga sp. BSC39]|uniref:cyclophane-forming radical SAM/SPASM peptide maturase GrrM/OscB n=1 Tax=Microvirga sp. BSC39 TaxID=1549810 RepID=UPI00136438C3|nr:cyclophane-forming radical SAM/SPASM peptide maturase GrrM/OscB [Microvirga sp. BSC39]